MPETLLALNWLDRLTGVGANLAEGSGRGSNMDYKRFIKISRGSLYETRYWLRRAYKRDLLTTEQIESLTPLLDELTPTLNAYLRSIATFDDQKPNTKDQKPIDS